MKNKDEHKNLRIKALEKLTDFLHGSEPAVRDMITLLENVAEPVELRRAVLGSLTAISFSSPAFSAQLPAFKQALRQLVNDKDTQLAQAAVERLAAFKDEGVQKMLLDGLEDHTRALVPDAKAIQLLGLDLRAGYYPVIRNILAHSSDPDVMAEAITALSGDAVSQELIHKILLNKTTEKDVRLTAIAALNSFNAGGFQPTLKSLIMDHGESNDIRTASLNALSLHNNLTEVLSDTEFARMVEDLGSSHDEGLKKISGRLLLNREKPQK